MTTKWFPAVFFCLLLAVALTSCAAVQTPVVGIVSSDVIAPLAVGDADAKALKTGTATVKSVLGLFASGDASIKAACRNGGITKIHSVNYRSKNFLGFIASYTTIVHGE